jgi:hypothetical protein
MDDQEKGAPPLPLKLSPQGIRGYLETRACIKSFVCLLETAASGLEKDKAKSAIEAIAATMTFLKQLNVDARLLSAFVEARNIIQREKESETLFEQRQIRDLWNSGVVSLLNEEGLALEEAAKKIYDHDPDEARRILVFRNNMKKGKTKGAREARDLYHLLKKEFRSRFPTNTGARALRASRAMMGKKG